MGLIQQMYTNETIPHYLAIAVSSLLTGILMMYYLWSRFMREWRSGKIIVQREDGTRVNIVSVDSPLLTKRIYYSILFILLGFNLTLLFFSKFPY